MEPETDVSISELKSRIRSSEPRQEIIRELYVAPDTRGQEELRPSELQDTVCPRTGTTKGSIYSALSVLQELGVVNRTEGTGRAVLYALSETGMDIAEQLGLTAPYEEDEHRSKATKTTQSPAPSPGLGFKSTDIADDVAETASQEEGTEEPIPSQVPLDTYLNDPTILSEGAQTADEERALRLAQQLSTYLHRTNVTLAELITAVDYLTKQGSHPQSKTDPADNTDK